MCHSPSTPRFKTSLKSKCWWQSNRKALSARKKYSQQANALDRAHKRKV